MNRPNLNNVIELTLSVANGKEYPTNVVLSLFPDGSYAVGLNPESATYTVISVESSDRKSVRKSVIKALDNLEKNVNDNRRERNKYRIRQDSEQDDSDY